MTDLLDKLDSSASLDSSLTRRRGFVQIIDSDPSRIELPPLCLPVYLLNGRTTTASAGFEATLRKLNMLEAVRRSGARELLVLSDNLSPLPDEIKGLWTAGLRSELTFVASPLHASQVTDWIAGVAGGVQATLVNQAAGSAVREVLEQYAKIFPEDRKIIRVRDVRGGVHRVDLTEIDDPERPILDLYSLIQEKDLSPVSPEELSHQEFVSLRDPSASWRPYPIRSVPTDLAFDNELLLDFAGDTQDPVPALQPALGRAKIYDALAVFKSFDCGFVRDSEDDGDFRGRQKV